MTLIELAFVSFCVCVGLGGGYFGFTNYGWIGAVLGAGAGLSGAFFFVEGLAKVTSMWHTRHPIRPICRNGTCQAADYEWVESWQGYPVCRCKCGTKYTYRGRRFLEILPDGTLKRFMRKGALRGWKRDE
jgi:uncharacterized membrane protein YuzA (DUF378 family)